jgi:hypothetical protein
LDPVTSTPAEVIDAVLGLSWILLRGLIATVVIYALLAWVADKLDGLQRPPDDDDV